MAGYAQLHCVIPTFLLLATLVTVCDGIICYTCNSMDKPECGDNFQILSSDLDSRFECPGSCFKRRGKRSSGGGEVRRTEVMRGCMAYTKERCFSENFNNLNQKTCTCNTDFCNSSPISYVPIYKILLCSFMAVFLIKFY